MDKLHLDSIERLLRSVVGTQDSIQGASKKIVQFVHIADDIAALWTNLFDTLPKKQLELLYVANDVLQTSRKTCGEKLIQVLIPPVGRAMRKFKSQGSDCERRVNRMISVWKERNVLQGEEMETFELEFEGNSIENDIEALLGKDAQHFDSIDTDKELIAVSADVKLSLAESKVVDLFEQLESKGIINELHNEKAKKQIEAINKFRKAIEQKEDASSEQDGEDEDIEYSIKKEVIQINIKNTIKLFSDRISAIDEETSKRKQLEEQLASLLDSVVGDMGVTDESPESVDVVIHDLETALKNILHRKRELKTEKRKQLKIQKIQKPHTDKKNENNKPSANQMDATAFLNSLKVSPYGQPANNKQIPESFNHYAPQVSYNQPGTGFPGTTAVPPYPGTNDGRNNNQSKPPNTYGQQGQTNMYKGGAENSNTLSQSNAEKIASLLQQYRSSTGPPQSYAPQQPMGGWGNRVSMEPKPKRTRWGAPKGSDMTAPNNNNSVVNGHTKTPNHPIGGVPHCHTGMHRYQPPPSQFPGQQQQNQYMPNQYHQMYPNHANNWDASKHPPQQHYKKH